MPGIEELADEFAGRIRVVKIDVEPDDGVLEAFGSRGLPTYLVFRDGVEVDRFAPIVLDWKTKERVRSKIERALAAHQAD